MTGPTPTFTDAELIAYLEGEGSAGLRASIDAALETDDALGERLAGLDGFGAELKPAFDALLPMAPLAELEGRLAAALTARPPRSRGRLWLLTGIAASVAGAFGAGLVTGRSVLAPPAPGPTPPGPPAPTPAPPRPAWLEAVAGYVRLFSAQTFTAAPLSADQRQRTLRALAAAVGLDLAPLAALEGLRLQRAEVLQLKGRPLGQIAYVDADGRPVAVCILVRPTPPSPPPRPAQPTFSTDKIDDLNIIHWDVQPYGFLVIGAQDPARLRQIAETVAARLA